MAFSKYIEFVKPGNIRKKAGSNGTPILPCILTDNGHVSIAIDFGKRVSKKFSYDQLLQAFEHIGKKEGEGALIVPIVKNSAAVLVQRQKRALDK
jgi:hypothetical protein